MIKIVEKDDQVRLNNSLHNIRNCKKDKFFIISNNSKLYIKSFKNI